MGLMKWLFGNGDDNSHHNQIGNNNYQNNSICINYGGDGRTCPHNWQLSYATCGCCPKMNTCKEGRAFLDSERRKFSDFD